MHSQRRVLVVDDAMDMRVIAERLLSKLGCEVQVVASGEQALEILAQSRFDVVLTDVSMPRMDGFELARRIRTLESELGRKTPVVAMTGHESEEYAARIAAAGMAGHIVKPPALDAFDALLKRLAAPSADDV